MILERLTPLLYTPVRCAKRKGYRLRAMALKRKVKAQKLAEGIVDPPKRTWLERQLAKRSKAGGVSKLYPPRLLNVETLSEFSEIEDDVYLRTLYRPQVISIMEALTLHAEYMHPTMLNCPDALVKAHIELNTSLKKKNKFVDDVTRICSVPHPFNHGQSRSVIAFVQNADEIDQCFENGAEAAGTSDLVKDILKGKLSLDNFDYVICHVGVMNELGPLRGILKKKYPSKQAGGIAQNVPELVKTYREGVKYNITKDVEKQDFAVSTAIVGRLNMDFKHIEENIMALFTGLSQFRNPELGSFIQRPLLMVEPSKEYFEISSEGMKVDYKETTTEKIRKQRQASKS